jgi:hypothetical protein
MRLLRIFPFSLYPEYKKQYCINQQKKKVMETKSNEIQDAKTSVDSNVNEHILPEAPVSNETKSVSAKNGGLQNVASGMVGGIAGAAGGAAIMGFTMPDNTPESISNPHPETIAPPAVADFDGAQTPVASHVTDDMSFNEAFASARSETGAGGVFFWKDGCYGTYYRDEWSQLSPEYKQAFSNFSYRSPAAAAQQENQDVAAQETEPEPTAANHPDEEKPVEQQPAAEPVAEENPVEENDPAEIPVSQDTESTEDDQVEVLGVQYVNADGQEGASASGNMDGQNIPIDVLDGGIMEGALNETSESGIETSGLTVTPEDQPVVPDTYLEDNHLPDYTNDGPVDNFIA